jgi:acyl carrier protein
MSAPADLTAGVIELVRASPGLSPGLEIDPGIALYDLGVDSLGWLRLIDAIERHYGVDIDISGADLRDATVQTLVEKIRQAG